MPDLPAHGETASIELLVSIRSEAELMTVASSQCVSIVDLKEPANGPLAPASVDLWNTAAEFVGKDPVTDLVTDLARHPATKKPQKLSAALGEFTDALACAADLPPPFTFAKMGSSDCSQPSILRDRWSQISQRLPSGPELVAVAYADFQTAGSLPPQTILESAIEHGCRRILIDTFQKDGRSSMEHLGIETLQQFASTAARSRMWWSLAGSIDSKQIDLIAANQLRPNCIGVRTAACIGARTSAVSLEKCQQLHRRIGQLCRGPFS